MCQNIYDIGNGLNFKHCLENQLSAAKERLKNVESRMKDTDSSKSWMKRRHAWQTEQSLIDKYCSALKRLIDGAMNSVNVFHNQGMLHLDIKGTYFTLGDQWTFM